MRESPPDLRLYQGSVSCNDCPYIGTELPVYAFLGVARLPALHTGGAMYDELNFFQGGILSKKVIEDGIVL